MIKNYFYIFFIVLSLILSACGVKEKADDFLDSKLTASPGEDISTSINAIVQLNGSNSTDILARQIKYQWKITQAPDGSSARLNDTAAIFPQFVIDKLGDYEFQLTTKSGSAISSPVKVRVSTNNVAPVAYTRSYTTGTIGETISLDGTESTDANGDELSYLWEILSRPTESTAVIVEAQAPKATLTIDVAGEYEVGLTVNDGQKDSQRVTQMLTTDNSPPVAVPGKNQRFSVGGEVQLDGSDSYDINRQALTFQWAFLSKPESSNAALINSDTSKPVFIADVSGVYIVQLIVSDGILNSKPMTVVIADNSALENYPPTANAGENIAASLNENLLLSATESDDIDGDSLTYHWAIISKPANSTAALIDPVAEKPPISVDAKGLYIIQLTVNDEKQSSAFDNIVILVEAGNIAPIANAGQSRILALGESTTLSAAASSDADNDNLNYSWSLLTKPEASQFNKTEVTTEIFNITPDVTGEYVYQLIVSDGQEQSRPVTITVTVETLASAEKPKLTDFSPKIGPAGTIVSLTGENFLSHANQRISVGIKQNDQTIKTLALGKITNTELSVTIPPGIESGNLVIVQGLETLETAQEFIVLASSSITFNVSPAITQIIQGSSGSYSIQLNSNDGFDGTALIAVDNLPSGLSYQLKPNRIAVGQSSILTIDAPITQAAGASSIEISLTFNIDGKIENEVKTVNVEIMPVTTAFSGRVVLDDTEQTPLQGVIISFLGKDDMGNDTGCIGSTTAGAAGNFVFTDLADNCLGTQLVRYEGASNVTNLEGLFADVDKRYVIEKDQLAKPPTEVHLPRLDDAETVEIIQNHYENQRFTFNTVPNLEVIVYAGATFTLKDGTQPNPFKMYLVDLDVDRLPGRATQDPREMLPSLVAFQPANTVASRQMAVTYPNVANIEPGTKVDLTTLDPTKGVMVIYGTGTVSSNGLQIIPDFDPENEGERFGLTHLDWHGPRPLIDQPPAINPTDDTGGESNSEKCPGGPSSKGNPVSLSSGLEVNTYTDMGLACNRGGISLRRTYRSLSSAPGPFGRGTNHNYNYRLVTVDINNADLIRYIRPDGSRVPFSRMRPILPTKPGDPPDRLGESPLYPYSNRQIPSLNGVILKTDTEGLARIVWKDGRTHTFALNPATTNERYLVSMADTNGNVITINRNPNDFEEITSITDPVGRAINFEYDGASRITKLTDPIGREVTYTYTNRGYLASVTDPAGNITRYEYDSADRLKRKFDARDVMTMENTYDESGRVIEQLRPDGGILKFAYKPFNAGVPTGPIQETEYTDAEGNTTTYRFNTQGYVISVIDSLGQTTTFERGSGTNQILRKIGNAVCDVCGDPSSGEVSYVYDAMGNVTKQTNALGDSISFTYHPTFNKPTSVTDPQGYVTTMVYDGRGNLTQLTDAKGNETRFEYDNYGQLIKTIDPLGNEQRIEYDAFANVIATTDALGNKTQTQYDAVSRGITTVDALGNQSFITYDKLNRPTETRDAKNNITRFEYDVIGNRSAVIDARGNRTEFVYNDMAYLVSRKDNLGKTDTRVYDKNGNLTEYVDRRGLVSQFEYDGLNRLITETYSDASTVTREYNARSLLIRAQDSSSGAYSFQYDELGRLTKTLGPTGSVAYEYSKRGELTQRQVIGQTPVDYIYDELGVLLSATGGSQSVSFDYDQRGQVNTFNRANNVKTDYDYDVLGRLTNIIRSRNGTEIDNQSYKYNGISNRTENSSNFLTEQYTQASLNTVDDVSNRLLKRGDVTYTYDDNGNRLTETNETTGIITTYSWDGRNRLQKIVKTTGEEVHITYDFVGNLINQQSVGGSNPQVQQFVLDVFTNVVQQSSDNGSAYSTLTGVGIDQHFAIIKNDGESLYGLMDGVNSTVATTDENGQVVDHLYYENFGELKSNTDYPFQFTGRTPVMDGLYYYRARFYDSVSGVFVSEDPIGFSGGDVNLVRYVANSSTMYIDPLGLEQNNTVLFLVRETRFLRVPIYHMVDENGNKYWSNNWQNTQTKFSSDGRQGIRGCIVNEEQFDLYFRRDEKPIGLHELGVLANGVDEALSLADFKDIYNLYNLSKKYKIHWKIFSKAKNRPN